MIEVTFIMNSAVQEIFSFKTCCGLMGVFDQNLEIHLRNDGSIPVEVINYFDLWGLHGCKRVDTLTPPGIHQIFPGELVAVYCDMDETLWSKSQEAVFYDRNGNTYRVDIMH